MARCGCGGSCGCQLTAGQGTTVSGIGSALDPWVVSADIASCTQVRNCIDDGPGTTYNPTTGIMAVCLSGAAGNTLSFISGCLYNTTNCAQVRTCLSQGNGISYNSGTGSIAARLSTDPNNNVVFGTDGGLYATTNCTQVRNCIDDGPGTTYNPATGIMAVCLSGAAGNTLSFISGCLYNTTNCAQVRTCISGGNGISYNPATGLIEARLSANAGNQTVFGPDGGLFTPAGAGLVAACGLTGNGSAATPLTANTAAWPYPCAIATNAGVVSCDPATGQLKGEPRTKVQFQSIFFDEDFPDVPIPATPDNVIRTISGNFTNPDTCRSAQVITFRELEFTVRLPAGATAEWGYTSDNTVRHTNGGTTLEDAFHIQTHKTIGMGLIAPGATQSYGFDALLGMGSNGATYSHCQMILRVMMISN